MLCLLKGQARPGRFRLENKPDEALLLGESSFPGVHSPSATRSFSPGRRGLRVETRRVVSCLSRWPSWPGSRTHAGHAIGHPLASGRGSQRTVGSLSPKEVCLMQATASLPCNGANCGVRGQGQGPLELSPHPEHVRWGDSITFALGVC